MHTSTHVHIRGHRHDIKRGLLKAEDLYQVGSIDPTSSHLLLELPDERDVPLLIGEYIVISGRERFSVAEGAAPADDNPCLRKPLTPVFNEVPLTAERALPRAKLMFGELAALDAEFESGDGVFIELGDLPDGQLLADARLLVQTDDRLYTAPCGNVGFETRLDVDLATARERYGVVDRVVDGARDLIVLRDQPLPNHWSRRRTDILVIAAQGYPASAMDMFWVTPELDFADGRKPANADSIETYAGQAWQRFSWHYPPTQPWNPATSSLLTHMRFVRVRLAQAN